MNENQIPDSASPLYDQYTAGADMDFEMYQSAAFDDQYAHDIQHQPAAVNAYSSTGYPSQIPNQWHAGNFTPHLMHQRISNQSFSSGNISFRSSTNSVFSHDQFRDSFHSAFSESSQTSTTKAQFISQADHDLNYYSTTQSDFAVSPSNSTSPAPKKRTAQLKAVQEKDPFKTCVSVTKQSRPCNNVQKYFCTACKRLFVEKADWKRHEETYQERREMFQCDRCSVIYFLDRDFTKHHIKAHGCSTCKEKIKCSTKHHVQVVRKLRQLRTGWGCGFCTHFSSSWTERCDHIARHIEKEEKTLADWHHSRVIYSLLQRPAVRPEWERILAIQHGHFTRFAWNQHSTGRVEGYPESNNIMQLQDRLEYFTTNDNATALAQLAYDKALKQGTPPEVLDVPPIPPPKDQPVQQIPLLSDFSAEMESWTQQLNSVIEDEILPTGVGFLEGWRADEWRAQ